MGTDHLNNILFICVVCFGVTVCSHVKKLSSDLCTALCSLIAALKKILHCILSPFESLQDSLRGRNGHLNAFQFQKLFHKIDICW